MRNHRTACTRKLGNTWATEALLQSSLKIPAIKYLKKINSSHHKTLLYESCHFFTLNLLNIYLLVYSTFFHWVVLRVYILIWYIWSQNNPLSKLTWYQLKKNTQHIQHIVSGIFSFIGVTMFHWIGNRRLWSLSINETVMVNVITQFHFYLVKIKAICLDGDQDNRMKIISQ